MDLNLDNKMLKVGNTTFNTESLKGWTKDEFKKAYKGKISIDIDEAWKEVYKYTRVKK